MQLTSRTKPAHGAFRAQEEANGSLRLLWEGARFPGQRFVEAHFQNPERKLVLREAFWAGLFSRVIEVPYGSMESFSLKVHRVEVAGDVLPLSFLVTYRDGLISKVIEVSGYVKGLDGLSEARDLLFRISRASALAATQDAFRATPSLEFGFYSEVQLQEEGVRLELLRGPSSSSAPIPEVNEKLDYEPVQGGFLRAVRAEGVYPSLWKGVKDLFAGFTGATYAKKSTGGPEGKSAKKIALFWILSPLMLLIWIINRIRYNASQVSGLFAFWRFLGSFLGVMAFLWVVGDWLDSGTLEPLTRGYVLPLGALYFLFRALQRREANQRWPVLHAQLILAQGKPFHWAVMLFVLLSLLSFFSPIRFQLMVWDLQKTPLRPGILSSYNPLGDLYVLEDEELARRLIAAPGVVEAHAKEPKLDLHQYYPKEDCATLSFLYAGLRLRGLTDQEIATQERGVTLFLGALCDEISPKKGGYRWSPRSPAYISWMSQALTQTPEGAFQVGLLPWDFAKKRAREIAQLTLTKEERELLLSMGLAAPGLLGQKEFTLLLEAHLGALKDKEDQEILGQVMVWRQHLIELLSGLPTDSPVGVTLTTSNTEPRPARQAVYTLLVSCGYLPKEGADLSVSVSVEGRSFPTLRAEYPEQYQASKYRTVTKTKKVGKRRKTYTEKQYAGTETKTRYEREDGPLAATTLILRFSRGEKVLQAASAPLGVVRKSAKGETFVTLPPEQLSKPWHFGVTVLPQ